MLRAIKLPGRAGVWLALLAVYVIWGSTYLGIRVALEGFPPLLMAGLRFLTAGAILYAVLRLRGTPAPTRREWGASAIVGGLLLVGGNGSVVIAEQWIASGLAALGVATVPLWTVLFMGLTGHWPRRWEWLALLLGFVGVVALNLEGDMRASPIGALALLFAAVSWAIGTVWGRSLPMPKGLLASATEMLTAGAMFLVLGAARGEWIVAVPGARPLLAFAYLIVFGSLVAFSAFTYLTQHVQPALATSYAYVNPVVAVALGVVLLGERITPIGIVAMLIIVGSVALLALGRNRAAAASAVVRPEPERAVPRAPLAAHDPRA